MTATWGRSKCSSVSAATRSRRERVEPLAVPEDGIWIAERQRMAPATAGIGRSEPRRASVLRLVKKHNIDLLGLQETHLHDQGVLDAQSWWLRKNGFAAHFNRQLDQSDKGSSGLVWRDGERREDLRGFTREERRIDRVHLPTQALHSLRSVYTVATPADHKAVVAQLGPVEDHGDRPRFRFPLELLEDPAALAALQEKLQAVVCPYSEAWWDSVRVLLREEAVGRRREHLAVGFTQLQALVRESTPVRLAPGANEFLQDLGYEKPTVSSAYQRLVRLKPQEKHEEFQERMVSKLRSQLLPR